MSVRVTERLIGDVVKATGLPNSPLMVVQGIDEEAKLVTTIWFSDRHECETGVFPGSAIDRFDPLESPKTKAAVSKAKAVKEKKAAPGRRGRKPAK